MDSNNIERVKEMVGDVALKTKFIELLFSRIKRANTVNLNTLGTFETTLGTLKSLRNKFAHGIILINPSHHPGEVFLSKVMSKENPWFKRLDGENIFEFCKLRNF